ncbi:MAG: alpha/beta hydrolase [Ilumatobacteraceae bacterium]
MRSCSPRSPATGALELDLHRPAVDVGARPLVVNIHGGGWRVSHRGRAPRETRAWPRTFHEQLVDAGFVVACPSYRFSSEALFPAAIEDVADAVVFLRAHADEFGVDADRVVLFGQSAGGYLAAAVGLGTAVAPVQGVVCWYPLTDFSVLDDDESAAVFPSQWLGAPLSAAADLVERARVVRLARADAPPVLLLHGTDDTMAPFGQSELLRDALVVVGASVELVAVEGAGHFFDGVDPTTVDDVFSRTVTFARTATRI